MIERLADLKEYLDYEKKLYITFSWKKRIFLSLCADRTLAIWNFQKAFRISEYFYNKKEKNKLWYPLYVYFKRKSSIKGRKLGFDFTINAIDKGLYVAHTGSIIVGSAQVGKNCFLHGHNTISSQAIIGDNCELWVGASVMDKAVLPDNTVVGGGAVVVSKFDKRNLCLVGVPAKILHEEYHSEVHKAIYQEVMGENK